MKKLVLTLILAFALSVSVFAEEGNSHTGGGRTCTHPPTSTCPGSGGGLTAPIDNRAKEDIFSFIRRILPDWF